MLPQPLKLLGRFHRDETGSIALMFGLTSIILFLSAGLAVDFGMAHKAKARLGDAADAAVLATAKAVREQNLTQAQADAYLLNFFNANLKPSDATFATITTQTPQVNMTTGSVQIDINARVNTFFGAIAGIDFWNVPVTSVALIEGKDIEVGLQLDVTGSMGASMGSSTRMAVMKTAAKDMVDILISDTLKSQKVRIGIAPFSAGVNAGTYATRVNGNRADTCTYERLSLTNQASDISPTGTAALKIRSDLPGSQPCPSAVIQPMTDNKSLLKATIDSFSPAGSTAGHLGTAWSWYLIAPDWSSVWPTSATPAPYNDGKTIKTAIIMTDGIYNTIGGRNFGDSDPQSNDQAKPTCEAMKSKQITLYSVFFGNTISTKSRDVMEACATDSSKFFFATNEAELRAAFRQIAQDITTLRLTK